MNLIVMVGCVSVLPRPLFIRKGFSVRREMHILLSRIVKVPFKYKAFSIKNDNIINIFLKLGQKFK